MKNKKQNILVISPVIPQVNTNAGDWRVFTLTKELSKSFNIFFMPLRDNPAGKKYLKTLKNIQVIKNMESTNEFSRFVKQNNIEILLIEKYWDLPFDVYKYMSLVKTSVIDVHEIGFKKSQAQSEIENTDNNKLYKAKELLFYKQADILIAISNEEQKELKKYFPDKKIIVIPTCTDVKKTDESFSQRKDICYFGFFSHKPNIDAVNYFIRNIFPQFLANNSGVKFYILGKGAEVFKEKHKNVKTKENIKDIPKELSKYRVLVCPLRYGAGVKKKVLDAMASKTPVVSTNFGYEGIIGMSKQSVSPESDKFIKKTEELYQNKNIWNKVSTRNFKIVEKYYSMASFGRYVKKIIKYL
ncbi:MAG: glycosyltransferase [Endomicrobiaceae bacterium]|nr:glycosyltransferase [Endomicrobiaceae bacterium]